MKHTKGYWEILAELNVQSTDGRAICSCGVNNGSPSQREENIANAKLIAAAPELLNALITIQKAYREAVKLYDPNTDDDITVITHNAIAKATG